ncbi:ARM repeat-containing protein [Lentinus tigrinus ALCF2SS1-7]|uniref:ARM repeat-containing protein n=1 Tax=Lentinus tigrinus ALCF2SS1-6 TaxID=1328759 RepID=A0A5C2SH91_9APHY|nr:ARM repeat-containing protein [Lentinus tigrinus ALCF2SS1-6]RPD77624.1 ARM repeat-containing protein [Lentinus tigrinus ALCF2SS1-7]
MDLQQLSQLFASTFSPDPNVQKMAEIQIRKLGGQEGLITNVLQIVGNDNVDLATRQAAAVYLKNRVYSSYFVDTSPRPDQVPIPPSDRNNLKASVLPLIAASPNRAITVQLAGALKNVVARDFPENWPNLVDEVKKLLASSNIREVHAGCVTALEMVRAFRFRQNNDILPKLVEAFFPILVNIATQALSNPPAGTNQEVPTLLHLILKTYSTSIILQLSAHQQSSESLVPWGRLLFQVVNLQIPKDAVPEDEDERERSEWWKAKKWAYKILGRLFHRFGNPSQLPSSLQQDYGAFAQHFVTSFAPEIFKVYLQQTELYVSGQAWLSKKCQYRIFTFFTECVKPKSTWALLKPHVQNLVQSYIYPQLSFTPAKQEQWETDPIEFVRTSVDEYEVFDSPVSAATSFLFSVASNRTKTAFLPILGFINQVLQAKPAAPQRYGALNMTAALGPFIMRHPDVKGNMEQFVLQHVIPEFSTPEPYMRAVACEVLGTMIKAGLKFSQEQHLHAAFTAVAQCIDDAELPVRVHACLALTEMVTDTETVKNAVAPQVGKVIQTLLKLSEETDLDILNHCMEAMVETYQTELLPVAADLTARLCETYVRLARESQSADETDSHGIDLDSIMESTDNEDKIFAAMGVAKTIATVVNAVDSSPEILAQVQEIIIPIVKMTLEAKLLDLFDNMYDLVDSLTYKLRSISPNMWPIFELTYKLFKSDAVDFLDEMLPSLDNFVSFGGDVFKQRPDYRQMVLDIYQTSITSDHLGENDAVNGCKLAESMLLNLRGSIDDALQPIIATALPVMDKAETNALRLANLNVLVNAILYNPAAALHILDQAGPGVARKFFDKWFAAINVEARLPRVHDKKLSIVALCALMELDPASIPESVKEGWPGIVSGALKLFQEYPKAVQARKELEEAFHAESDDDDDDDDSKLLNLNEDEEDVWDEDSAYVEMLANEGQRLREKSERQAAGEDVSDDEVEEDIEEELGYISPLDTVHPYVTFKQALTAFQMKNGPGYQLATTSLSPDLQTFLMEVMRLADEPAVAAPAA